MEHFCSQLLESRPQALGFDIGALFSRGHHWCEAVHP
jgi:hypothetical protein